MKGLSHESLQLARHVWSRWSLIAFVVAFAFGRLVIDRFLLMRNDWQVAKKKNWTQGNAQNCTKDQKIFKRDSVSEKDLKLAKFW